MELAHASFSYRPLEAIGILPIVNFSYVKQIHFPIWAMMQVSLLLYPFDYTFGLF